VLKKNLAATIPPLYARCWRRVLLGTFTGAGKSCQLTVGRTCSMHRSVMDSKDGRGFLFMERPLL